MEILCQLNRQWLLARPCLENADRAVIALEAPVVAVRKSDFVRRRQNIGRLFPHYLC